MTNAEVIAIVDQCAHELLEWVGFGTLVGLLAKAIMPGRDPGGAVGTVVMGIGGSVVGCGMLLLFFNDRVTPISWMGFAAATTGAFFLLLIYRILSRSVFVEAEDELDGRRTVTYRREYRRRRAA